MSYNLRSLHFALSFFPVYGGMTARIYNLMNDDENRHTIFVPTSPSKYIPQDLDISNHSDTYNNMQVQRIQLKERYSWGFPVLDYIGDWINIRHKAFSLKKAAEQSQYDFVYGHGPLEFAIAAKKFAERYHLPFIYEVHGLVHDSLWIPPDNWKGAYHRYLQKLFTREERDVLHKADAIVCQTEMMKKRIIKLYKIHESNIFVISNGVDTEKFAPDKWQTHGLDLRKKHLWESKYVFMYAGLFDQINGIDQLLSQFQNVPSDLWGKIRFVFLGRGGLQEDVQAAAQQYSFVDFLGMVDYKEIPAYISASDVFIIPRPSTLPAETLVPMKLLEAMAMEKIVLVSDVGGMSEVVENGKDGFLYQKGNPDNFWEIAFQIVQNGKRNNTLGIEARKKVMQNFTWDTSKKKLQSIYKRVTDS
jgi:glycosyltransferase involved in cell wall biosynthesis